MARTVITAALILAASSHRTLHCQALDISPRRPPSSNRIAARTPPEAPKAAAAAVDFPVPAIAADSAAAGSRRDFLNGATTIATGAAVSAAFPRAAVAARKPTAVAAVGAAALRGGDLKLPPIGLGAWAWGDSLFWGYNPKEDGDLREVFDYAVSKKLAFFDTAELYGLGRSEKLIGNFRKEDCTEEEAERVIIASKFAAFPFRTKAKDVVDACTASVKRLGGRPIDLYQIHFPNAWENEAYWDGLADAYDRGLVKAVGVSNYGSDAVRACSAKLAERGIKLASNQIQMSLLYRYPIENGLLDTCKELNVKVLSYSPLALGFLTGKYNKANLPSGPRQKIAKQLFEDDAYEQLLKVMADVGAAHKNAPISQVAINWAISKGTTPIPGARNLRQVKQNFSTLDWKLTKAEMKSLDVASARVTGFVTPDKSPFPKKDINTGLVMFDS